MAMTVPILQPPLTDDAHSRIHFSNWEKSLATAAHSMCRTLDECGAYSLVADDSEWESYLTNIVFTTSSAGTSSITYCAPPVITKPTIYTTTEKKTAVIINLFNYP